MSLETIDLPPTASQGTMTSRDRTAFLLLGLWVVYALWTYWNALPPDLSAVYVAGWLWNHGQTDLIYAIPEDFFGNEAESWNAVTTALAGPDLLAFPYVYPPLWAVLAAPATEILGVKGFSNAMLLVQVPMLAASVLLAGRLAKPQAMSFAAWVAIGTGMLLTSVQAQNALQQNQPTITVTFLLLLAFVCLDEKRPVAAGAALALAAAIKLSPAAFALIFLVDRQYRAFAAFALTGAALALLSLALAGIDLHLTFLATAGAVREQALLNAVNISLLPALMAFGSLVGLLPPFDTHANVVIFSSVPGWLHAGISLTAGIVLATFLVALRRHPGSMRRAIGLFALSLIVAIFGPLGWLHYYLLPLLLLPSALGLMPQRTASLCGLGVAFISFRPLIGYIALLPWPVAGYLWLSVSMWLAVLAALYLGVRRPVKNSSPARRQ